MLDQKHGFVFCKCVNSTGNNVTWMFYVKNYINLTFGSGDFQFTNQVEKKKNLGCMCCV